MEKKQLSWKKKSKIIHMLNRSLKMICSLGRVNNIRFALVLIISFCFSHSMGQQTPAPPQKESILIKGATLHLGEGTVIENGSIGFDKGVITYVGKRPDISSFSKIITAKGGHVYPGFIALNTNIGLEEIGAVLATHDFRETGTMNPNVRSIVAYNSSSKISPTIRTNGILLAQIAPQGGIISGSSSVVQLDSWTWQDALVKQDDGIHVNFRTQGFASHTLDKKQRKAIREKYDKSIRDLKRFFLEAKAYNSGQKGSQTNLKFESLKGVFKGNQNLFIHADFATDILHSISFFHDLGIKKIVLVGGSQSHKVAQRLKKHNIPVILHSVHSLPRKRDDPIDLPYKIALILQKAGLEVALENPDTKEPMRGRNLPFLAGTLVAYGMDKESALKTITSTPAQILGLEKHGVLKVGNSATLFISEGDALDMMTNKLTHGFIGGRSISLDNHQKALYRKYKKKLGIK